MGFFRIYLHFFCWRGGRAASFLALMLAIAGQRVPAQTPWSADGPDGGDARALAAVPGQPSHLYLGTTDSWIYESLDSGASWHRLSKLASPDNLILDHIVVDAANPSIVYAAAWTIDHPGGGLWVSHDGARNWSEIDGLRGQSIRAFAQAPSNPRMLFAGTLDGVFRSTDGGANWTPISPPGDQEIHNVESLAVDPADPNIVYAGTWHLPWKTTDGGATWHSIKQGMIDDSDVFSIIIDPAQPSAVFLSACSGIYSSVNAGELFQIIKGIPSTARRTRVLKQDPANRDVVYAGTTEGLYKTMDGGKTFQRMTGPDVIVNDVFVDPRDPNRVLLATDRSGVLSSRDAGASFAAANDGFSERKVEALLVDSGNPARLFAGVANDKSYGGVFVSTDGGASWDHIGEGLDGRDVFALAQAPDGTVLAGTNSGIFALDAGAPASGTSWRPRNTIQNALARNTSAIRKVRRVPKEKQATLEKQTRDKARELDGRVYALDLSGDAWLASTSSGLLTSRDQGASWQGGLVMGSDEYLAVAAHGTTMAAARRDGLVISTDGGLTWMPVAIPASITRIHCTAFSADGTLWLGAREGVYLSRNLGKSWLWIERLPFRDVNDLYYDAALRKVLASSQASDFVYSIDPATLAWKWTRSGWNIFLIRAAGERLVAASMYDGVVVEPPATGTEIGQR
jgi:photosystem II stability/assembly factor-like uncharacterized protein